MKIIDTFMFFDENMMLDIRLNILYKHVNKFIICESTYNHNGETKKLTAAATSSGPQNRLTGIFCKSSSRCS